MGVGNFILMICVVIIGIFIILEFMRIAQLNTKVDVEELDYKSKELKKALRSYSKAYTIQKYKRNGKSIYTKKGEYRAAFKKDMNSYCNEVQQECFDGMTLSNDFIYFTKQNYPELKIKDIEALVFDYLNYRKDIRNTDFDLSSLNDLQGCSVTKRIGQVKQPRGGYINPRSMTTIAIGEGLETLNPDESIHANLVGLAVDYLTRYMLGTSVEEVFCISMMGARIVGEEKKALKLMAGVNGLDKKSVINSTKLSGFDVCYRAGPMGYKPVDGIMPDSATVENIITMVNRSLVFFEKYGPKVLDGFTFEGGYTDIVVSGDGDFTTKDTLWDFKVSKRPIKKEHTLQLLMYWRMGLHSIYPEFKDIQYLGIYNPRQNTVSRIAVTDIPESVIKEVEAVVIGYKE